MDVPNGLGVAGCIAAEDVKHRLMIFPSTDCGESGTECDRLTLITSPLVTVMHPESPPGAARSLSSPEQEHTHMLAVFSVTAGMVGVCLTAIGLIQVMEHLQQITTLCDEILAFNALLFLCSCVLSYWALHHRFRKHYRLIRLAVDTLLMCGIVLMVTVCAMIAYSVL